MASLIFPPYFNFPQKPISRMNSPYIIPIYVDLNPPKIRYQLRLNSKKLTKNQFFVEFSRCFRVVRMCSKWENEVDSELELQVLEFMKKSKNPALFPSKNELVNAGRMDLVEGIMKNGGWMSMGWDDNEVKMDNGVNFRVEKYGKNDDCEGEEIGLSKEVDEGSDNSSSAVSPSCQSIELEREDDPGIKGILQRLERQRNLSFGVNLGRNGNMDHGGGLSKDDDSCHHGKSVPGSPGHDGPMYSGNGSVNSYSNTSTSSLKADTWRAWSVQRAGYSDKEFEAAEIDYGGSPNKRTLVNLEGKTVAVPTDDNKGNLDMEKDSNSLFREISQTELQSRLQHLELELSSALRSLSSNATDLSMMVCNIDKILFIYYNKNTASNGPAYSGVRAVDLCKLTCIQNTEILLKEEDQTIT